MGEQPPSEGLGSKRGCDVSNNQFSRRVPFGESTFGGQVILSNSVFVEMIHLDQCRFSSHIDFYGVQFAQRVDLQKSQLQTPLVISAASISLADTRLENGGHIIVTEGSQLDSNFHRRPRSNYFTTS